MKEIRLVILSGPSGSGKSTAVKALEDLGFFCVDNMPVTLLVKFLELITQSGEISRVAAVVDIREREFLKAFPSVFAEVKNAGYATELIYLESSDDSLVKRFSETRRRHPLSETDSPLEGVLRERELLGEVKARADKVIDTTHYNVHELRLHIKEYFSCVSADGMMTLNIVSFGYRYGIPNDADIVMDVRFLPNPYFVDELKGQDGTDGAVCRFVMEKGETKEFLKRFTDFMNYLIPLYRGEGKAYLTIAIGCTGGRHRSVVVAMAAAREFASSMVVIKTRHRDIDRS